jgi:type I restriction enzyme S subunit
MVTKGMRKIKLKEVCDRITVGHVGPMADKYTAEGVPFLRSQNITAFRLNLDDIKYIPPDFHEKLRKSALQAGDVAVVRTGYPGTACVIPNMFTELNCADLVVITPSRELNPYYLAAIFNSAWGVASVAGNLVGVAQQHFNIGAAREMEVSLPPRPTQDLIAGILSPYDELIENSQRRISILESMARVLYREWFVHFRFPGHEQHPRVASPLGDIPQGWEVIPFETLLVSMTGGDWGSDQPTATELAEVTIVRGTDFDEVACGGQLRAPVRYIKPSSLKSRGLRPGDVIVENSINAKSRCIGTTLLVDSRVLARIGRDAVAASFCKVFRLHDPRLAPLVHLHFRRLREDARMEYYQNVAANGIGNFQGQKFAREEHLILPKDAALRSKLVEGIAALFESISVLSSKLSNLRRTRDLLLPRLLSGQIDVEAAYLVPEIGEIFKVPRSPAVGRG